MEPSPEPRRRHRACLRASLDHVACSESLYANSTSVVAEVRAHAVRDAVARVLSDKQREAIEAHFFEDLSESEIARRFGVAQQVVHKRIHGVLRGGKRVGGAIAKLRAALAPLVTP